MSHSNYRKTRRQNPLPDDLEEGGFEAKVGAAAIRLQAGQTEEEVEADLVLNHGVDGPMAMLITRAARVLLSEWEPKSERDTKPDMRVAAATPAPVRAGRGSRVLLGPTDDQVLQAIDSHAGAFVDMAPVDFLRLTTLDEDHIRKVQSEAHDLAKYEKHMESGKCEVHPFLRIDVKSGQVVGHDGRHRAAAILSADPDAQMRVALIPVPLSKTASMADIPETVKGEYDPGFRLKIRKNVTVVDANVQQGCAGCGKPEEPKQKKTPFQDTVLRRDAKGQLFLMNRPEKGWSSYGIPYPSEQAVLDEWDVTIGPWTSDKHSAFAPVKKNRKENPVGRETFYVTRTVTDRSGNRPSHGYVTWLNAYGKNRCSGPVEINLSLADATYLAERFAKDDEESMAPPGRYVVFRTGGSTAGMTSEEMDADARSRIVASFPVKLTDLRKENPAREPIVSYRNDETGMESYVVYGNRSGVYNVTMRDLDSGEWVPGARIGIASLDEAKALAQKWAGVRMENPVDADVADEMQSLYWSTWEDCPRDYTDEQRHESAWRNAIDTFVGERGYKVEDVLIAVDPDKRATPGRGPVSSVITEKKPGSIAEIASGAGGGIVATCKSTSNPDVHGILWVRRHRSGHQGRRGYSYSFWATGYRGDERAPIALPEHSSDWKKMIAVVEKWVASAASSRLENPVKKPKVHDAWSALGLARPKPIAEDKLAVLLPKLRKRADSSLTAAHVVSVAQALGWTVEPMVYVAVDQAPFKDNFDTHHLSAAEDYRASLLARALPGPPETLAPGERAVWNVSEIVSWPRSNSPTGYSYHVTSDQAVGVVGLRFVDTNGKVIDYVPGRNARDRRWKGKASPTVLDSPGFMLLSGGPDRADLRDASSWLDDINRRLGTEPHVERPRTREGTATCWFCWRNIKMAPNGLLVHHGYQRPGTGEIHGDCLGVHRASYELAVGPGQEALAAHQRSVNGHRDEAARLRSGGVTEMHRRSYGRNGNDIVVPSGEPGWGETQDGRTVRVGASAWARMIDDAARRHESLAESEEAKVALYQHAVDSWQKRPLPTEKDFEFDHLFRLMKETREKA